MALDVTQLEPASNDKGLQRVIKSFPFGMSVLPAGTNRPLSVIRSPEMRACKLPYAARGRMVGCRVNTDAETLKRMIRDGACAMAIRRMLVVDRPASFSCQKLTRDQQAVVTRFQHLIALLVASILIYVGLISGANSAQSPPEKFAPIEPCLSDGHFESWSPSGKLVLLNDNHFLECDLETGAVTPTNYSPSRTLTFDELRANSQKPVTKPFPDAIKYANSSTGELIIWTHVAPLFFKYDDNYIPVEKRLIGGDQGELAIYTAAPIDNGSRSGKSAARFAFAYRKDAKYKIIEIDVQPHKHELASGYPWGHLASSVDYTTGRVLMFFQDEALYPDTKYIDGWSPFNVWWFDPKTAALTHLVLPDGTWVKDADKPRILSNLKNFPVGVGGTYNIKAGGGKIFLLIDGTLSESSLGIWMFSQPSDQWKKIANKGVDLKRICPDGCKLAVDHPPSVAVLNLCGPG